MRNAWLRARLDTLLPELMARAGLDMWLVIAREYNEDPVIMTLLPQPAMSARRRTILLFYRRPDGSVERLTVSRYAQPGFYDSAWQPEQGGAQYAQLAQLIAERDPQQIGINSSTLSAFADGLSQSEYAQLVAALPETYRARLVSAESLCIGWLERRLPDELAAYPQLVAIGHALIAEAFSRTVIHPGITTTDDVVWWLREAIAARGLQAWFQPTVMIQAHGEPFGPFYGGPARRARIMPGDLLHCDVGFHYLGLATDQQQHAYVLRPGESEASAGLQAALAAGNRLQEILIDAMRPGKTGNAVLAQTLARARAEGLDPMVYTHPLGYHGHAAGPTIGLWDQQDGVPGLGDYPLYDDTCYSIELNVAAPVAEWGDQVVRIMLEEDAVLSGGRVQWLHGRQTALHLV